MSAVEIAVVNSSVVVTDDQVVTMITAVKHQLGKFASSWKMLEPSLTFYPAGGDPVPATAWVVTFSSADGDGAGGTHGVDAVTGLPKATIYGDYVLGLGGGVFGPGTLGLSVSISFNHEVLEMLGNPYVNTFANGPIPPSIFPPPPPGTQAFWFMENVDQLASVAYMVNGNSGGLPVQVMMCPWVLPAWFNDLGVFPFDCIGFVNRFSLAPSGGYLSMLVGLSSDIEVVGTPPVLLGAKKEEAPAAPAALPTKNIFGEPIQIVTVPFVNERRALTQEANKDMLKTRVKKMMLHIPSK